MSTNPNCQHCDSENVRKNGILKATINRPDRQPIQRYRCNDCNKSFIGEPVVRTIGEKKISKAEAAKRYRQRQKQLKKWAVAWPEKSTLSKND